MFDFARAVLTGRLSCIDHEDGATAVEYGLLIAFIAGAIVVAVAFLGGQVVDWFTSVNDTPW